MKKYTVLAIIAALAVSGCADMEGGHHGWHKHHHEKADGEKSDKDGKQCEKHKGHHGTWHNRYDYPNDRNCSPSDYAHGWC